MLNRHQFAEVEAHERNRKRKGGLVAGVALAGLLVTAGTAQAVSADEVVKTDNPATNLVEAQATPTAEAQATQAQAGTQTGEMVAPVESTGLDQVVVEANQAGVIVEETPIQTVDSLDQANADLANQEATVDQATDTQKQADATLEQHYKCRDSRSNQPTNRGWS